MRPNSGSRAAARSRLRRSYLRRENREIRVALIGAGRFGAKRAEAVGKSARSALTVVADINTELAETVGQKFHCRATTDWREAVTHDNVDAVIVSTPAHLSAEVSFFAAQAGKHILSEKPCAVTSAQFAAVVHAA